MSVTVEVGLERRTIHSVRAEESASRGKHRKDTHPEATGTSILILGRDFRAFGGATLDCLATFSVGSGVDVRVRFYVWVLGATSYRARPLGHGVAWIDVLSEAASQPLLHRLTHRFPLRLHHQGIPNHRSPPRCPLPPSLAP